MRRAVGESSAIRSATLLKCSSNRLASGIGQRLHSDNVLAPRVRHLAENSQRQRVLQELDWQISVGVVNLVVLKVLVDSCLQVFLEPALCSIRINSSGRHICANSLRSVTTSMTYGKSFRSSSARKSSSIQFSVF